MSTGLRTAADVGRKLDNRTWMPAESVVISSPPAWQASATKNAGTAAVRHDRDAIATRDGCDEMRPATSNSSWMVSVRITPACWNSASAVTPEADSIAPV